MRIVSSLSAGFLALLTFALTDGAQATSLKTIYKFCSQRNCKDGRMPTGAVTRDAQGNFYAVTTTVDGGAFEGTIDELIPGDKHYKAKILHNYNDFPASGPNAGVILDVNGTSMARQPTSSMSSFRTRIAASGSTKSSIRTAPMAIAAAAANRAAG